MHTIQATQSLKRYSGMQEKQKLFIVTDNDNVTVVNERIFD